MIIFLSSKVLSKVINLEVTKVKNRMKKVRPVRNKRKVSKLLKKAKQKIHHNQFQSILLTKMKSHKVRLKLRSKKNKM